MSCPLVAVDTFLTNQCRYSESAAIDDGPLNQIRHDWILRVQAVDATNTQSAQDPPRFGLIKLTVAKKVVAIVHIQLARFFCRCHCVDQLSHTLLDQWYLCI